LVKELASFTAGSKDGAAPALKSFDEGGVEELLLAFFTPAKNATSSQIELFG
jgi:hypothetical protein